MGRSLSRVDVLILANVDMNTVSLVCLCVPIRNAPMTLRMHCWLLVKIGDVRIRSRQKLVFGVLTGGLAVRTFIICACVPPYVTIEVESRLP